MEELNIQLLGGFALRLGDRELLDTDTRARKAWILLAYLICQRDHPVSQKKLIDLLWGENPDSVNPENALRITMHRTRALLEQFCPEVGREMILRRRGGYQWNGGGVLDSEQFEALCRRETDDAEQRIQNLMEAISLYRGDFLPRQSAEVWVIPISTYLHNLFLDAAREAVDLLAERGRIAEAVEICRRAIALEPYGEVFCRILMQLLAGSGDRKGAAEVYETLSRRLFDDFGITPSEETRAVYRASVHAPEERVLSMDDVMGTLWDVDTLPGAFQCDYDYFKVLCHAVSRAMERNGNAAHVVLLNLSAAPDKALNRQGIDRIMGQFGHQIRLSLRRGDVFCQCSVTQYVILLPKTNYENSQMICERIFRGFRKTYPYINVKITHLIRPLQPASDSRKIM